MFTYLIFILVSNQYNGFLIQESCKEANYTSIAAGGWKKIHHQMLGGKKLNYFLYYFTHLCPYAQLLWYAFTQNGQ